MKIIYFTMIESVIFLANCIFMNDNKIKYKVIHKYCMVIMHFGFCCYTFNIN